MNAKQTEYRAAYAALAAPEYSAEQTISQYQDPDYRPNIENNHLSTAIHRPNDGLEAWARHPDPEQAASRNKAALIAVEIAQPHTWEIYRFEAAVHNHPENPITQEERKLIRYFAQDFGPHWDDSLQKITQGARIQLNLGRLIAAEGMTENDPAMVNAGYRLITKAPEDLRETLEGNYNAGFNLASLKFPNIPWNQNPSLNAATGNERYIQIESSPLVNEYTVPQKAHQYLAEMAVSQDAACARQLDAHNLYDTGQHHESLAPTMNDLSALAFHRMKTRFTTAAIDALATGTREEAAEAYANISHLREAIASVGIVTDRRGLPAEWQNENPVLKHPEDHTPELVVHEITALRDSVPEPEPADHQDQSPAQWLQDTLRKMAKDNLTHLAERAGHGEEITTDLQQAVSLAAVSQEARAEHLAHTYRQDPELHSPPRFTPSAQQADADLPF